MHWDHTGTLAGNKNTTICIGGDYRKEEDHGSHGTLGGNHTGT